MTLNAYIKINSSVNGDAVKFFTISDISEIQCRPRRQSDQDQYCLPFNLHFWENNYISKPNCSHILDNYGKYLSCPNPQLFCGNNL